MEIKEFAVTFGVQYGRKEDAEKHPLGMYADGYAVIEAPSEQVARAMSFAIFEKQWSFIYPLDEFMTHERREEWHPAGELLRIQWKTKEQMEALQSAVDSVVDVFGIHRVPHAPSPEAVRDLFGGDSEDVLWGKSHREGAENESTGGY